VKFTIIKKTILGLIPMKETHARPRLPDIEAAHKRIQPYIHRTPVLTSQSLNQIAGAELFFKCENYQKAGAFKVRGACNAVFSLSEQEEHHGIATHSSGNHAQALALAAKIRGTQACIVMPTNAPKVKIDAVRGYGAEIRFCEPTMKAREDTLEEVLDITGAHFIPPYNDYRIIAGQGTVALEMVEQTPTLDILLVPVGGGGLISGTAITISELSRQTRVIGVEPEQADDAYQSFQTGQIVPSLNPQTIADGLRTSLGSHTFPIIRELADDIVTVSENAIIESLRLIWERMKIIIEPSAAVPFAALLEHKLKANGKRVGIILSGGNIDLEKLPW
jgi:threonine dehydratase